MVLVYTYFNLKFLLFPSCASRHLHAWNSSLRGKFLWTARTRRPLGEESIRVTEHLVLPGMLKHMRPKQTCAVVTALQKRRKTSNHKNPIRYGAF
uniref:Putative secreted protein n=1 Tax=Anopheles darlingi TaxID=43151 RepID=A0A2M4D7Y5_ANODA